MFSGLKVMTRKDGGLSENDIRLIYVQYSHFANFNYIIFTTMCRGTLQFKA